jgi:hypothetical protein
MVDEDVEVVVVEVEVGMRISHGPTCIVGGPIIILYDDYPPKTMVKKAFIILDSFFMSIFLNISLICGSDYAFPKNLSTARSIAIYPPSRS